MLKLCWTRLFTSAAPADDDAPVTDVADLRIGNLLDDPRLRRAMGLDAAVLDAVPERPQPRFDRRRLLDEAAA